MSIENKKLLEENINFVSNILFNEYKISKISDVVMFLLNFEHIKILNETQLLLETDNTIIECHDTKKIKKEILDNFTIKDINKVKTYLKHEILTTMPDKYKLNFGKYYTPHHLVQLVKTKISPLINKNTFVMDIACGCGAFLEDFNNSIGTDIDSEAIMITKLLNIKNTFTDNSLLNISRSKYNITNDEEIIIIGNPPYNDAKSQNKRNIKTTNNTTISFDKDVYSSDMGHMFLKAYNKLNANYICILHPLAYLIKQQNFNKLKNFTNNYKLIDGTIFSSTEFPDLSKNTASPVVAALYEKNNDGMSFDYIKEFEFSVLNSSKVYKLSNFQTIDEPFNGEKYIRKYPTKIDKTHIKKSDIGLYFYNFRDTNSLMSSANLMQINNNLNLNYITIDYASLYKYAYVNMYKHFFKNDFLFGNLSPVINIHEYENNKELQDLMIIGTILKNKHRIDFFDIENGNSVFYTHNLLKYYNMQKTTSFDVDFYNLFTEIIFTEDYSKSEIIYNMIKSYFSNLKQSFL